MDQTVILAEQNLSFAYNASLVCYYAEILPTAVIHLVEGQEYTVVWDGVEYKRTAFLYTEPLAGGSMVAVGNTMLTTGTDDGTPFAISNGYNGYLAFLSTDAKEEHTVSIYQVVADETTLVLKDRQGNNIDGLTDVVEIKVPTSDGGFKQFLAGERVEKTVDADFSVGDMEVTAGKGQLLSKVTVEMPDTLIPENIVKDIEIAGIVGTNEGGGGNKRVRSKAINFYDAVGNLVYSYTRAEAAQLTELPPVPQIEGLLGFWSHTLAEVQAEQGFLDVGSYYATVNALNNTVIASMEAPRYDTPMGFCFYLGTGASVELYLSNELSLPETASPVAIKTWTAAGIGYVEYTCPATWSDEFDVLYLIFKVNLNSQSYKYIGGNALNKPFLCAGESTPTSRGAWLGLSTFCTNLEVGQYGFASGVQFLEFACCTGNNGFSASNSIKTSYNLKVIAGLRGSKAAGSSSLMQLYNLRRTQWSGVGNPFSGCTMLSEIETEGGSSIDLSSPIYVKRLIITGTTVPTTFKTSASLDKTIFTIYVPDSVVEDWKTAWPAYIIEPLNEYPDY